MAKYNKQGSDMTRVPKSFEPVLTSWRDDYPAFVGLMPSEEQHTMMMLDLRMILFGEATWTEWSTKWFALPNRIINSQHFKELSDEVVGWLDKWDALMQSTPRQFRAYLTAHGTEPYPIRWINTKECSDVKSILDEALELLDEIAASNMADAVRWRNLWQKASDTAHAAVDPIVDVAKAAAGFVTGAGLSYLAAKFLPAFGGNGVSFGASPSGQLSSFVNADIPPVVMNAFMQQGAVGPVLFDTVAKRAASAAKRARKVIMNRVKGSSNAVASFGNNEIKLGDTQPTDLCTEAALEACLYDHFLLCSAYCPKPGSTEAYMYADMYSLPIMANCDAHARFRDAFDEPSDEGYWELEEPYPSYEELVEEYGEYDVNELDTSAWMGGSDNNVEGYYGEEEEEEDEPFDWNSIGEAINTGFNLYKTVKNVIDTVNPPSANTRRSNGAQDSRFGEPQGVFTLYNGKVVAVPLNGDPEPRARAISILNEFLSQPALIVPAPGFPFYTGQPAFSKGRIARFSDSSVGLGSTSSPTHVKYMSDKPVYNRVSPRMRDEQCTHLFDRSGALPANGVFYQTSLLNARLADLPDRVYGQINVETMPYQIEINRNYVDSRMKVSFVHEALHAITELLKLGLSHEQLHALSVFITSEVLPGYLALEKRLRA